MLLLLLPFLFLVPMPSFAQDLPRCTPDVTGALVCMAERLCECGFRRGGLMTGQPDGWGWDCGILRGHCGRPTAPPIQGYDLLPPGFSYDSSDDSIHLNQTTGVNGSGQQIIDGRAARSRGSGDRAPTGPPRRLFTEPPGDGFDPPF